VPALQPLHFHSLAHTQATPAEVRTEDNVWILEGQVLGYHFLNMKLGLAHAANSANLRLRSLFALWR
jgi:hypothetical protein